MISPGSSRIRRRGSSDYCYYSNIIPSADVDSFYMCVLFGSCHLVCGLSIGRDEHFLLYPCHKQLHLFYFQMFCLAFNFLFLLPSSLFLLRRHGIFLFCSFSLLYHEIIPTLLQLFSEGALRPELERAEEPRRRDGLCVRIARKFLPEAWPC